MNIQNKIVEVTLNEKTFKMKFDFETIANIQSELKAKNIPCKFYELFKGIEEQDFSIIVPVMVHSIRRVHPNVSAETIKDLLTFDTLETVIEALVNLIDVSMPREEGKDSKKK